MQKYPKAGEVKINDSFWTPYLRNVRCVTLPYTFKKMEEYGFFSNYASVANKDGAKHKGPPFSDGLYLESLRGACDFLADEWDPVLEAFIDRVIAALDAASEAEGGFLCTCTTQNYAPNQRWGDNDGDIVRQHDIYNHGTLVEAAISHYNATGKTTLLKIAVRAANLICETMGPAPKKNIIPGHSLTEEAFVKLYRLFRDDGRLTDFAKENRVNCKDYLDMAEFWYDARGNHEGRFLGKQFNPEYNQDHITFAKQTEAVGHSVRAMLLYLGAAVVAQEKGRDDYVAALNTLWENVVYKKLHISGGIGARHDIEGFDKDYNLPNRAYLETCAAIGLAFWNTEMNILSEDSKYFDCFERSLYNNVMSAIGDDFRHFFYQNPLECEGELRRWAWHDCPCCPPMLLKIFASLPTFIYSYSKEDRTLLVNMNIGSEYKTEDFSVKQCGKKLEIDSNGNEMCVKIRIPEYAKDFKLKINADEIEFILDGGYARICGQFKKEAPITIEYEAPIRRVFANPNAKDDIGRVAIMKGPFVYCAEGYDNRGNVDIEIAENPELKEKNGKIIGIAKNGKKFTLIPYYTWCNRGESDKDHRMAVWLRQENMPPVEELSRRIGKYLYANL